MDIQELLAAFQVQHSGLSEEACHARRQMVKNFLVYCGINLGELAAKLEVSRSTLERIIKGEACLRPTALRHLKELYTSAKSGTLRLNDIGVKTLKDIQAEYIGSTEKNLEIFVFTLKALPIADSERIFSWYESLLTAKSLLPTFIYPEGNGAQNSFRLWSDRLFMMPIDSGAVMGLAVSNNVEAKRFGAEAFECSHVMVIGNSSLSTMEYDVYTIVPISEDAQRLISGSGGDDHLQLPGALWIRQDRDLFKATLACVKVARDFRTERQGKLSANDPAAIEYSVNSVEHGKLVADPGTAAV